jgi:hypothetical protein
VVEGKIIAVARPERGKRGGCTQAESVPFRNLFDIDLAVTKLWAGAPVPDTCHISYFFFGPDYDSAQLVVGATIIAWCRYNCEDLDRLWGNYASYNSSTHVFELQSPLNVHGSRIETFPRAVLSSPAVQLVFKAITAQHAEIVTLAGFTVSNVDYSRARPTHIVIQTGLSWIIGGARSQLPSQLEFEDENHCFTGVNHGDTLVIPLGREWLGGTTFSTTRCIEEFRVHAGYAPHIAGKLSNVEGDFVYDRDTNFYKLDRERRRP